MEVTNTLLLQDKSNYTLEIAHNSLEIALLASHQSYIVSGKCTNGDFDI